MKIGLTGSIGTGKSTVASIFRSKNIKVIDADKISREIMDDNKCILAIFQAFGDKVMNYNGKIDRAFLRNLVFSNTKYRKILEEITHPLIDKKIDEEYKKSIQDKLVIFDIPLLFEVGKDIDMDIVIVVACSEDIQIKRIIERDNTDFEKAKLIINTQMPQQEKIKKADIVIYNNGSFAQLQQNVEEILENL